MLKSLSVDGKLPIFAHPNLGKQLMKKTIQLLGILISFSVFSANPSTDGDDKLNDVPKVNDSLYQPEKVDYNQVKEVFRPNKRVERLLLPSKKSIKKKYTIA